MKRYSPVIFGLLVAATLAVDAVAIVWYHETKDSDPLGRAAILYDALISAQLAIATLWAVFSARQSLWGWTSAIVAVLVAAVSTAWLDVLSFAEACGIYGTFVALLAAALWILKRTAFWQRLTGVRPTVWQFSLAVLIAAMTLVAVLIVSLRHSELVAAQDVWRFITLLTIGDVLIVVTTAIAWAIHSHVLTRLAAAFGAAATLGVVEAICVATGLAGSQVAVSLDRDVVDFMAYATIVAVVVFIWLELVPVVPHDRRAVALPPAGADAS